MKFSHTLYKYYKKRIFKDPIQAHKKPLQKKYQYFFIIPSYAEKLYIEKTLDSINQQQKKILDNTLVIIVLNNSKDAIYLALVPKIVIPNSSAILSKTEPSG